MKSPLRVLALIESKRAESGDPALGVVIERVVLDAQIRVCARPVPGGCELAAIVPWSLFGFAQPPAEFPFDVVVDVVDPLTGEIVQRTACEPVWDGWRCLKESLVLTPPPAPPAT